MAEYSSTGHVLWAKKVLNNAYFNKFIYSNNSLYVSGNTNNNIATIDTSTYISNTFPNAFLSRFTSSGNVISSKYFYSNGSTLGGDVSCDTSGNIYITGAFHIDANLGFDTLFNSNSSYDLFFIKYNSSGNLIWAKQANATNSVGGGYLLTSSDGSSYIGGAITGIGTFGSFTISTNGTSDMFVARYNSAGDCLGVEDFDQFSGYLGADNSGNYFIAGELNHPLIFGGTTLTAISGPDVFLAKHDVITGTHTESRAANDQLIIYANPTAGKCNITIPDDFLNEKNLTLNIYDNMGRLIQSKTLQMNDGKISLNLEEEAKGIYHISLSNGRKNYQGKIIFN